MISKSWILVNFLSLLNNVYTLPQGAPTKVCNSMLPFHGGGILPQTDVSPYVVSIPNQQLGEGSRTQITLTSPQGFHIQGFMLQGRRADTGQPIGKFTEIDATIGQPLHCNNGPDTITHVDTTSKSAIVAEWEAPSNYLGTVVFNTTIAQDYSTFWVGVESSPIQIVKRSAYSSQPGISTTRYPISRTTPPSYSYSPVPTQPESSNSLRDPFYDGCGTIKSCFGTPAGCEATQNCKAVAACTVKGERYEFELKSMSGAYVALGLSDDDKMGDDSTIECVRENYGAVKAYMGYTTARPNLNAFRLTNSQDGIRLLESNTIDGTLYCRISRDARSSVRGKIYDLINDKYHLLIAAGNEVEPNKVKFHTNAYAASAELKSLADVSGFTAASKILLRLHGAFMVSAWIGTASLGILLARYYRQTWVDRQLCGKDQWFAWHRFFMAITWLLTMAGFILIFVELQAWSSERNPHAILGTLTTILCFLQPIGAFFRPHPGTPKRPYFNWLHWLGGNVAHILAIVSIFFAVKLNKAELPEWMDWILVGFVAFHVVMHLILSLSSWLQILGCISDKPNGHRVSSFPMKEMGQGRNSVMSERKMDAPHSCLRKFLLAVYLIGIVAIVAALVVIIVLAPINETIESLQKKMT